MNAVRSYLEQVDDFMKKAGHQLNFQAFLLRHGREWEPARLPKNIHRGQMGECYRNASLLAISKRDLTYIEGVALNIIPVGHAWCIDRLGRVVDNTWPEPQRCQYFGIPFKTKFLMETLRKRKVYGLLEYYGDDMAIEHEVIPPAVWKKEVDTILVER